VTGLPLVVRNWRIDHESNGTRVSADVGDMNVWFRIPPGVAAAETGDAFLAVALIPAMALGAGLDLTALPPISSELLGRLGDIQDIWTSWNPLMHRIDVRANQRPSRAATMSGGAAFFSGGVDALFTALERRADLDQLVFINGFDFNMTADVFAVARARVARQAALLGMPLVAIETNWIDFTRRHRIARTTSYGGALAGVALLLAPERMVIASSYTYARLVPNGSHPLLDPLWSTGTTQIEHYGCQARRNEKLMAIVKHPEFLQELWVCHRDPVKNCGTCPKCLRLRLSLWLVGKDQLAFPAASGDPVAAWCRVAHHHSERSYLADFTLMAHECGRDDAVRRLNATAQRLRLRGLGHLADAALFGGAISRIRRRGSETPDLLPSGIGREPEW
jgi:hypothetical protein